MARSVTKGRRLLRPITQREPAFYGRLRDRGQFIAKSGFLGPAVPKTPVRLSGPAGPLTAPTTATYTATLDSIETADVVIELEHIDGSAVYGTNYEFANESTPGRALITITAGLLTGTADVDVLAGSPLGITDYTIRMRRVVSGPGLISAPNAVTTDIAQDLTIGVISLEPEPADVNEGQDLVFTVTSSVAAGVGGISGTFSVTDITATLGEDYDIAAVHNPVGNAGDWVIANGQTTGSITLEGIAGSVTGLEEVRVEITAVDPPELLGTPSQQTAGWNEITASQPTLDWTFAQTESLTDDINSQVLTFLRASNGTFYDNLGVLKTALNDVARFDNAPNAGGALGLLMEEQRTNLIEQSEELDGGSWSASGATVTPNDQTAPDGNLTAELVEGSGTVFQTAVGTAGQTICFSAYFQNNNAQTSGRTRMIFATSGEELQITWASATPGADIVGLVPDAGILDSGFEEIGNGWWRVFAVILAGGSDEQVSLRGGDVDPTGCWIWGAQVEVGDFATSYIPTGAVSATRAVDRCNTQAVAAFTNAQQSINLEFTPTGTQSALTCTFVVNDGTGQNRAQLNRRDNDNNRDEVVSGNVTSVLIQNTVTFPQAALSKYMFRCEAGNYATAINGNAPTINADPDPEPVGSLYNLIVGASSTAGSLATTAHYQRVRYFANAVTDQEMTDFTT